MIASNHWPQTASFEYCGVPVFTGKFVADHYEGEVSEPFHEAFHDKRLKAHPAHEVDCLFDDQNDVIGYDIRTARFNLEIEPKPVQ